MPATAGAAAMAPAAAATNNSTAADVATVDVATYIQMHLGPQKLDYSISVPMTIIYCALWLFGMTGNLCTCLVVARNAHLRNQTYIYLTNLAITDMLTLLVAMPLEVYSMWHQYPWRFGEAMCDFKTVFTESVTCASILTVVTFTVERYVAICHPLSTHARHSKSLRAFGVLAALWLFGVCFSLPWIIPTKVNYLNHPVSGEPLPESAWCNIPFQDLSKSKIPLIMMIVTTVLFFVLPLVLVATLYCRIGMSMHRSGPAQTMASCSCACATANSNTNNNNNNGSVANGLNTNGTAAAGGGTCSVCAAEKRAHRGRKTVVRMLVAVVICFFLCWSPYHAQRLLFSYLTLTGRWNGVLVKVHHYLYLSSGLGYYLSCCVNPIVYCAMSKQFRRGLVSSGCCGSRPGGVGAGGNSVGMGGGNGSKALTTSRHFTVRHQTTGVSMLSKKTLDASTSVRKTGRRGSQYCSVAVFAEAKDNNSTLDNSHGDGRDFHSEGELKQTSVTLNNRVKSSTGIRDGSRSGGSVNGNIGSVSPTPTPPPPLRRLFVTNSSQKRMVVVHGDLTNKYFVNINVNVNVDRDDQENVEQNGNCCARQQQHHQSGQHMF